VAVKLIRGLHVDQQPAAQLGRVRLGRLKVPALKQQPRGRLEQVRQTLRAARPAAAPRAGRGRRGRAAAGCGLSCAGRGGAGVVVLEDVNVARARVGGRRAIAARAAHVRRQAMGAVRVAIQPVHD
jgi:hypothetical protein